MSVADVVAGGGAEASVVVAGGDEVTDDDRYANASLAVLGLDPSLFR